MPRILVVDDEPAVLNALHSALTRAGHEVLAAADGVAALAVARREAPDLVILDVMLPGMDGFQVCRALRQGSIVPILMLTARDEEPDKVLGLELGADDYLTKPFSMRELLARVRALLRRAEMVHSRAEGGVSTSLGHAGLELDLLSRRVALAGRLLRLRPREFDLLAFLMAHQGHVFSRRELLEKVWGYEGGVDTRTVDVHVRWLREKLESDPSIAGLIETVRGVGYRFGEPSPSGSN